MGNEPLQPIASQELIEQGIPLGNILMPYAMKQAKAFFEKKPNQTYARWFTTRQPTLLSRSSTANASGCENTNCLGD